MRHFVLAPLRCLVNKLAGQNLVRWHQSGASLPPACLQPASSTSLQHEVTSTSPLGLFTKHLWSDHCVSGRTGSPQNAFMSCFYTFYDFASSLPPACFQPASSLPPACCARRQRMHLGNCNIFAKCLSSTQALTLCKTK